MKKRMLSMMLALVLLVPLLPRPGMAVSNDGQETSWAITGTQELDVPGNGEALRQKVLEYAYGLSEVEWICAETVDFTKAVSWSPNLLYQEGQIYHGLPYNSDRPSNNANLKEFLSWRDDNGYYVGPTSWNEMAGGDCGAIARLSYAWAGALYGVEMEELQFDPGEMSQSFGLMPLGDYDWTGFARPNPTSESVNEANGEEKMYDCYSQFKAGDCVFVLYPGGGEHIMLVTGEPTVVTDGNGKYIPQQCTVPILEWTSGIHNKGAYMSNFNDCAYTYADLYSTGFIPLTMEAFSQNTLEDPSFTATGIDIGGEVGFHDLMSGKISGNYNIFTLTATITDAAGETVLEGVSYPNSLRASLTELSYGGGLMTLPSGSYHYTLKAEIGYGEITVVDTDIQYIGCDGAPVVYISDAGTGNGSSPDAPMGNGDYYRQQAMTSYREGAFYKALEMLSDCGGTVVLCGDVTLDCGRSLTRYTTLLTPYTAPVVSSNQTVTVTSNYGGVDYRQSAGAELILRRTANQATNLELNIGSIWRDVDFRVDYSYTMLPAITTGTISAYIACLNHSTVFEETFSMTLSLADVPLESSIKNNKYYPDLYGGGYNLATDGDTDLTVLGGSWNRIVGGSEEAYLKGGTNVTVGGNACVYDSVSGGSGSNLGAQLGNVTLNITGGTLRGKLILAGSGAFDNEGYSVTASISGWPDLSGLRIVNAGTIEKAGSVTLDMGGFKNGGGNFTAYINENEYTSFVAAPEPEPQPGENESPVVIVIAVSAGILIAVAVAVAVVIRKKKRKGAVPPQENTD